VKVRVGVRVRVRVRVTVGMRDTLEWAHRSTCLSSMDREGVFFLHSGQLQRRHKFQ
jgi:hypothetical protein